METSELLGDLAAALAATQAELVDPKKGSVNPHFKNRYADLADVLSAVRPVLTRNGLAVVQGTESSSLGAVTVTTMLVHTSGQWVRSSLTLPVGKPDAQGFGSAITYARRYSIAALVGVAPDDDDDANLASRPAKPKPAAKPKVETAHVSLKQRLVEHLKDGFGLEGAEAITAARTIWETAGGELATWDDILAATSEWTGR